MARITLILIIAAVVGFGAMTLSSTGSSTTNTELTLADAVPTANLPSPANVSETPQGVVVQTTAWRNTGITSGH